MLSSLLTWLMTKGLTQLVDAGLKLQQMRLQAETDQQKIALDRYEKFLSAAQEILVKNMDGMVKLQERKMAEPIFWVMVASFVFGLSLWWNAVMLDSVFQFSWNVADLPTKEIKDWAGSMISWLFYVGTGVAALKVLK